MARCFRFAALCIILPAFISCAPSAPPVKTDVTVETMTDLFMAYKTAERTTNKAPQSADDIKAYLKGATPDEVFISPNDNQPFVVLWGNKTELRPDEIMPVMKDGKDKDKASPKDKDKASPPGPIALPILAYEKTGVGGKRYVVTMMGEVKQLTDEEFRKARFLGGHKPPP